MFTGHSFGGVIASVIALKSLEYLKRNHQGDYLNRIKAFTFGVCAYAVAENEENDFFNCLYNVICSDDPVPSIFYHELDMAEILKYPGTMKNMTCYQNDGVENIVLSLSNFLLKEYNSSKEIKKSPSFEKVLEIIKGVNKKKSCTKLTILGHILFLEDKKWDIREYKSMQKKLT